MSKTEMINLVKALMQAKQSHDIDSLLALYDPSCILEQPSLGVRHVGLSNIRRGLESFATHFPDYRREFEGFAADSGKLISWGDATFTITGQLNGHTPNGQQTRVKTFVLFQFLNNRICYEGHFWDLGQICRDTALPISAFIADNSPRGQLL